MKTNRSGLLAIVTIAIIASSSCVVEHRPRHPAPKKVIVVGKADATEKANNKEDKQKAGEPSIAVF